MTVTEPPNHHADFPAFTGVFGLIAGLSMVAGRKDYLTVTAARPVATSTRSH